MMLPFENLFLSFSSPEKAFEYQYDGNAIGFFEGEKSSAVLYLDNKDKYNITVIRKSLDGWKLNSSFTSVMNFTTKNLFWIGTFRARDINEIFIFIFETKTNNSSGNTMIWDSRDSDFFQYTTKDKALNSFTITYTIVDSLDEYILYIDGDSIGLTN